MTRNILVPIDLADMETARKVVEAAVEQWQDVPDPHIIVMTVVPEMIAGLDWRYAIRGETGGSEEWDARKVVKIALDHLDELASDLIPEGVSYDTVARYGSIYEEVLEVADELKVDQIVIGAHRPRASDFLIGPNTARIVRHAKCSVTVVRHSG